MPETSNEVIVRYLEDVIAAEKNFEDQLAALAKMGDQGYVRELFSEFSAGAERQRGLLTERLRALGGSPSTAKSFLAHFLAFSPMLAQTGQDAEEKSTQHLIMVIAAAGAEMAMYEALATVAAEAGDGVTERLARDMQDHERSDRERAWNLLATSASQAFHSVSGERTRGAA